METTANPDAQLVSIESNQLDQLAGLMSFNAGLVAVLALLVGGLVLIEIHRG